MNQKTSCPVCYSGYQQEVDQCDECGFPFSGTEEQRSKFIGQHILKKGKLEDAKTRIKRAQNILWIIGGINILTALFTYASDSTQLLYMLVGVLLGLFFIGAGFLAYKRPFVSILVPLILLLLLYLVAAIQDPVTLFQGILLKVVFIGGLVYALMSMIEAEKIRKENDFMKKQPE